MNQFNTFYFIFGIDTVELIGQIASITILVALIMPSIRNLRIINLCGATLMFIYGILISKYPIMIMNAGSVLVNAYYLFKMFTTKYQMTNIEFSQTDEYLRNIVKANNINLIDGQNAIIIFANMEPINLLVIEENKFVNNVVLKKRDRREIFDEYISTLKLD